jgi:hypothetical protein
MAEQKQPKRRSSGFHYHHRSAFALLQTSRSDTGIGSVAGQRLRSDGRLCSLGRTRVNYSALDFE